MVYTIFTKPVLFFYMSIKTTFPFSHKIDFVTKKGSKKHRFCRGGVKTRGGVQKVQKIPPKKHQFLTLSGPWTSGGGLDPPRRPPKKGGGSTAKIGWVWARGGPRGGYLGAGG